MFTVDFDEDTGGTTPPPATSFNDGAENDSPVRTLCVTVNGCSSSFDSLAKFSFHLPMRAQFRHWILRRIG